MCTWWLMFLSHFPRIKSRIGFDGVAASVHAHNILLSPVRPKTSFETTKTDTGDWLQHNTHAPSWSPGRNIDLHFFANIFGAEFIILQI